VDLKTYTVSLTDLVSYTATIVAHTAEQAEHIATRTLFANAKLPMGYAIADRATDTHATLRSPQPPTLFETSTWYSLRYVLDVPAQSEDEAREHFKRLVYDSHAITSLDPAEDKHGDINIDSFTQRSEVRQ